MEIRVLARQGMGIRAIARELEVSRNTVRRMLRGQAKLRLPLEPSAARYRALAHGAVGGLRVAAVIDGGALFLLVTSRGGR